MEYQIWVVIEPGNGGLPTPTGHRGAQGVRGGIAVQVLARWSTPARSARELGYGGHDTKITFLDDDTSPTWEYLETAYAGDYDICQGLTAPRVEYGSGPFTHYLLSHIDDLRFHNCMTYCSSFQGIFNSPLFVHGEGLTITGSTEQQVGWNFRIFASEDLTFGCNAAQPGASLGLVPRVHRAHLAVDLGRVLQAAPPLDVGQYPRDRQPGRAAVRARDPGRRTLRPEPVHVHRLGDRDRADPHAQDPAPQWGSCSSGCSLLAWAANFALSGWVNAGHRDQGQTALRFWANRVLQTVMAVVLGPFSATLTIVALVATHVHGQPEELRGHREDAGDVEGPRDAGRPRAGARRGEGGRMTPARRGLLAPYLMTFVAVLVSALVATFVFGKDYRSVAASKKYFHRHAFVPSFDPITDALVGYSPSAMSTNPGLPSDKVRTIEIFPRRLVLLAGGAPVRTIALAKPVTTLKGVAERIGDPSWITVDGSTLEAKTAIIAQPGAFVRIAKPKTAELVLHSTPGRLPRLGGGASPDRRRGGARHRPHDAGDLQEQPDGSRPAVRRRLQPLEAGHPELVVPRPRPRLERVLRRLLVARLDGERHGLDLRAQLIGVYTDHAHDLLVKGNVFRGNTLYGVDPHSYSVRMDIEDNLAEGNGRHGIIFSDHVTDGLVRNNTTRDNDLNGIMMDASSTENRIVGNLTERNRGDGIVLASSPHNVISGNRILHNRIGLQARGPRENVTITGNEFVGNCAASQGLHVPSGNAVHGNGGQWKPAALRTIWVAAGPILLLLVLLTVVSQRKYNRPKAFQEVLA